MKAIIFVLSFGLTAFAHAAQTITAQVNGMVCAFCAQGIEKKVRALPETQDVYVNLKQKIVAAQLKEGEQLSPDVIAALIKEAGYDVAHIETVDDTTAAIRARMEQK